MKNYEDDWCLSTELNSDARDVANSEHEDWAISRNHSIGERKSQIETYKHYDQGVLKTMGEQGDLLALSALVDSNSSSKDTKEWAARTAAIYGGTGDAMSYFSISNKGASTALMRQGKTKEAKAAFLESVAWDEFSALRGDISLIENIAFTLSFDEMKDVKITEQDEAWISARAKEIYFDLSQERSKLGLGSFDNSVPKVVEIDKAKLAMFTFNRYNGEKKWFSKYFPPSKCLEKSVEAVSNSR